MTGARIRTIDIDGPLHVEEYGERGVPIVCVHGLGGSSADWQLLAPRLAVGRRVYALDLPGFGGSPLGRRSATIEQLRAVLDRFLHEHVGEPAVLVGNSMGGMLSLLQAVRCPASVDRLVLLCPVVPVSRWGFPHPLTVGQFLVYATPVLGERYLRTRRRHIPPDVLVRATFDYLAGDPRRIPSSIIEERMVLAVQRAGDHTGDRTFLAAARSLLRLLATPRSYRRALDRITAPVLLVHGDRDRLVSVRAARAAALAQPSWTVEVLDGVGHVPQLEAVDDVAAIVTSWLPSTAKPANFAASG